MEDGEGGRKKPTVPCAGHLTSCLRQALGPGGGCAEVGSGSGDSDGESGEKLNL